MIRNDKVYDALASEQRRQVLVNLLEDDSQSVPELSEESRELLTADEGVLEGFLTDSVEIANTEKDTIRLYHTHLPMLAEYGFIKWEREMHFVTKGPQFEEIKPLLEVVDEHREDTLAKEVVVPLRR